MLIYKATLNGKCYIGQAQKIRRMKIHLYEAYNKNNKRTYNTYFHRAIRKHGYKNVQWEILEDNINDTTIFGERETFNIIKHDTYIPNGYNMTTGGEGNHGYICSEKVKEKLRKIALNRPPMSEETKRRIKENGINNQFKSGKEHPLFGKHLTKEQKKTLSDLNKGENNHFFGKKHSKETKELMRKNWHKNHSKKKGT